ncbi:MAG: hypothetical protein ACRD2D_03160, partial [Terriglobales bacterium]
MILVLVVAATVFGYRFTGNPTSSPAIPTQSGISSDIYRPLSRAERIFSTATTLSAIADSADERAYSEHTQRLADELLDTGFAIAMQQAAVAPRAQINPNSPEQERIKRGQAAVAADEADIANLRQQQGGGSAAGPGTAGGLDVATAQLALDRARLTDAMNDAVEGRQGAPERLQELQQEH